MRVQLVQEPFGRGGAGGLGAGGGHFLRGVKGRGVSRKCREGKVG